MFAGSYAKVPITKAIPQQQRSFPLAAQKIRANKTDGSMRILGNCFWHAPLTRHMGKRLTVRFDPDAPRAVRSIMPFADYYEVCFWHLSRRPPHILAACQGASVFLVLCA